MEENRRSMTPMVVTMILSLGIGFLLGWYITGRDSDSGAAEEETIGKQLMSIEEEESGLLFPQEEKSSPEGGKNELVVNDQPAGSMVVIARAVLEQYAWIAIHEDKSGVPGNILGARLFSAGTTSDTVELLRAMVPGKVYYAMAHRDDGDKSFDIKKDTPMKNDAGQIIMVKFSTTASAQTQ